MPGARIDLAGLAGVVTGGGAGIGQGIALGLARCGADVAVLDIDPQRAEDTAERVRGLGRSALPVEVDVMQTEQVRSAIGRVEDTFGRIDILVNNAGGVTARRFVDQSERSWRRHIDLNLVSMLAATSAVVPVMIRGGRGGSIVNVSSSEASRAAPMFAVYAACKAAMHSFTRSLAVEVAEHGIRVNAIAPDLIATPGLRGLRQGPAPDDLPAPSPALAERIAAYVPLGREGVVADCAAVATFLCSSAASYITGVSIPVDGGTWASSGWTRSGEGWSLFGPDAPVWGT